MTEPRILLANPEGSHDIKEVKGKVKEIRESLTEA